MENGKLYIVATPIGNIDDITLRAIKILKSADCVAAEDTRQTALLFSKLGISAKLFAYHEFNEDDASDNIVRLLRQGKNVALVSDAGTPCISDPGYLAVKKARKEGLDVIPIPGACAFTGVLSVSGLAADRFIFQGFLVSANKNKRKSMLKELMSQNATVILYEAPHRVMRLLEEINDEDPESEVFIGREITKRFEQFIAGHPKELLKHFEETKPKGEFVVIINKRGRKMEMDREEMIEEFEVLICQGLAEKDAMKQIAKKTGRSKSEVYSQIKIQKP
jgi:16S rRNA (cytidine1402-2'-O)-methyltransferase